MSDVKLLFGAVCSLVGGLSSNLPLPGQPGMGLLLGLIGVYFLVGGLAELWRKGDL